MQKFGWVLVWLGAVPAVLLGVLWAVPAAQLLMLPTVVLATFIPYLWLPIVTALVGAIIVTRKRWRRFMVVLTTIALAVVILPVFGSFAQPGPAGDLQFISINAQYGWVDAQRLRALVRPTTDLVVIQEYTPELAEGLAAAGFERDFPHVVATPRTDPGGAAVYAREPLELLDTYEERFANQVVRTSAINGVQYTVANIHVIPPTFGVADWNADSHAIAAWLAPHVGPHFVALGDFNAISQHATMDPFFELGLFDPQSGITLGRSALSTWQPTWPVGMPIPPFARIDHALLPDGATYAGLRYVSLPGTDHKAVVGGLFAGR